MRSSLLRTFILIFLFGCGATSSIIAFKDPAYLSKQFKSIAVFAQGMSLAAALEVEKQVCGNLYPTPCASGKSILPPARQYTSEEVYKHLTHSLIDGVLFIALVDDCSDTRYLVPER